MFDGVAKHYDRTNSMLSVGNAALGGAPPRCTPSPRSRANASSTSPPAPARLGRARQIRGGCRRRRLLPGHDRGRPPEASLDRLRRSGCQRAAVQAGEFDAVTISFGLRNIENPKQALAEMYRVTKPGGRLVICEFSKPPRALFRAGYWAYLKYVMPVVVTTSSSNPEAYSYLLDSIQEWPDQETLAQWIRGAGFTRVAYRNLTVGIVALHRGRKPLRTPRKTGGASAGTIDAGHARGTARRARGPEVLAASRIAQRLG